MKKILFFLWTLISVNSAVQAQTSFGESRPAWMEKVYVGGGIGGIGISSNEIFVNVNGLVGYRLTEKLEAGLGINYQYYKWKPTSQSFNDWGFNIFSMYHIYSPVFLMAQYQIFYLDQIEGRETYDAFLLGGGITQPIGSNGALNFYALYNLSYADGGDNGRYGSPWVIGMNVGFGF